MAARGAGERARFLAPRRRRRRPVAQRTVARNVCGVRRQCTMCVFRTTIREALRWVHVSRQERRRDARAVLTDLGDGGKARRGLAEDAVRPARMPHAGCGCVCELELGDVRHCEDATEHECGEQRDDDKLWALVECDELLKRPRALRDAAEEPDQESTACDQDRAIEHVLREHDIEEHAREQRIVQQTDCSEWREDHNRQRADLEQRASHIRDEEYGEAGNPLRTLQLVALMCGRERCIVDVRSALQRETEALDERRGEACLLYTSDAADERIV